MNTKPPSARAVTLARMALERGWMYGAELGVYEAATTDHLLSAVPGLCMLGVDVWQPIPGGPKDKNTGHSPKGADVIAAAKVKAYAVQSKHGSHRLLIVERRTVEAADEFGPHFFDFVFVDASHVTADVVADIRAWTDRVRVGGCMLGHDANWPAIQAALREVGWLANVTCHDGNVWCMQL